MMFKLGIKWNFIGKLTTRNYINYIDDNIQVL